MFSTGLALRLLRGDGRRGAVRFVLMVLAVALTIVTVALAMAYPLAISQRDQRAANRMAIPAADGQAGTIRYLGADDSYLDRRWMRVLVSATPSAPLPPGLSAYPEPGESVVSPALAREAERSPRLASRLGVIVGQLGAQGLQGPEEYVSYSGLAETDVSFAPRASRYGGPVQQLPDKQNPLVLSVEMLLLAGAPALLFLLTAARLSAATRVRRIAALRLVGLSGRHLRTVAGAEAAAAGGLGAATGLVAFGLLGPALGRSGLLGIGWFPGDVAFRPVASFVVVLAVAWLCARVAGVGVGRVLRDAMAARRNDEPRQLGIIRLVPAVFGVCLLAAALVLSGVRGSAARGDNGGMVWLLCGMLAAVLGLLWALGPMVRGLAGLLAARTERASVRLGARRLQFESSGVVRVVTGLVLLVLVAMLGTAVLASARAAAGADARLQHLSLSAREVTADRRWELLQIPTKATVVHAVGTATDTSGSQSPAGVTYVTCRGLEQLTGRSLPGCVDGRAYRVLDPDPNANQHFEPPPAGSSVTLTTSDAVVRQVTTSEEALTLPGAYVSFGLDPGVLLVTSLAPTDTVTDDTSLELYTGSSSGEWEELRAQVAEVAPSAMTITSRDMYALEAARVHGAALRLGLTVAVLLAMATFVVATVDRILETRKAVASLVVLGSPRSVLRRAQAVELLLTMGPALTLALIVGWLAAATYLRLSQTGEWARTSLSAGLAVAAAMFLLGLLPAAIPPRWGLTTQDLRRE